MLPEGNNKLNIDRFSGFEDVYDLHRPEAPQLVPHILCRYLGEQPRLVLDIGCGTGLSTFIWSGIADEAIGIEPNADMIGKAQSKLASTTPVHGISFMPGYSNALPIASGRADIITCSQSFHWMEPVSTLQEVSRVLREGGVFAAYDCDWPPALDWKLEAAYEQLIELADNLLNEHVPRGQQAAKRDKEQHLEQMKRSGVFRYTREITFHNEESFTAERYVGLAVSQGGLQAARKLGVQRLEDAIAAFQQQAEQFFQGRQLEALFSYPLRLAVK